MIDSISEPRDSKDSQFYMIIFGSQTELNLPQHSHVFALFAGAANKNGRIVPGGLLETHHISWLPEHGSVEALQITPVPGKNFSLPETLEKARALNARVSRWGPFQISKELFDMAVAQEQRLNDKAIDYIMVDLAHRGKDASNCIHAVSDIDIKHASLMTGVNYGDAASQMICTHLADYIIPRQDGMEWLCERLGLNSGEVRFAKEETAAFQMSSSPKSKNLRKSRLSVRLQSYVADYGDSHQTSPNKAFHFVGIPLLMISAVGLLSKLSVPAGDEHPMFHPNAAFLFLLLAALWYLYQDAISSILLCAMFFGAYAIGTSLSTGMLAIGFGIGAVAHIVGHAVFEKKPPSLLKNPISILVAPAWLLKEIGY